MSLMKYWWIERILRVSYFHSPLYFTCAEISTSMESTIQVESGTTGYACQQLRIWGLEFDWTLPLDKRRGHSNSLRLITTAALTDITLIH